MSDIVERLRTYDWVSTDNDIWNTLREAADEIERLRGDNEQLRIVVEEQAREVQRLREENNVLASLLECWLNPMLRKDGRWSISVETLEQLVDATKKTLETRR